MNIPEKQEIIAFFAQAKVKKVFFLFHFRRKDYKFDVNLFEAGYTYISRNHLLDSIIQIVACMLGATKKCT